MRSPVSAFLVAAIFLPSFGFAAAASLEDLVSRADIHYAEPGKDADQGLPIGNGRMGTLVWTEKDAPATLMFQLNRNDTFSMDRTHKHYDPKALSGSDVEKTDNVLSLCRLAVNLGAATFQSARLQPYPGAADFRYATAEGELTVRTFVAANRDVLAVHLAGPRASVRAITVDLSMIRPPLEHLGECVRQYTIEQKDGAIVIVQTVREAKYFMHYAVAFGLEGGRLHVTREAPDRVTVALDGADVPSTLLLASAASNDEKDDIAAMAIARLAETTAQGYEPLRRDHEKWWADFWTNSRTYIHLTSPDGVADYLEALYTLQLYNMGSSSRGKYPPLYNYSLWYASEKDNRAWGAQYKYWNDSMCLFPLYAANQLALTDSYLGMFRRMLPDAEIAARQRYGVSRGAFIPETVGPSGPVILSEKAAPMVRDLLMGKRTRASLPPDVIQETLPEATLDWINPDYRRVRGDHYTWLSHIFSSGSAIAMQFWWRYELTGDQKWLRDDAYPMMKAMVEFYADYAKKGDDGKYHIYPSNVHETYWGVRDGIMDLAAIRTLVPKTIAASELLGVDEPLRAPWQEFADQLAPYPLVDEPDVERLQSQSPKPPGAGALIPSFPKGTFGAGHAVDLVGKNNVDPVWVMPLFPYEAISLARGRYVGTAEDRKNFDTMLRTYPVVPPTWFGFMWPCFPSRVGLADEVKKILPWYAIRNQSSPNGMQGAWGMANFGLLSDGIQSALLQSNDGLLIVAPAWPREWDADFQLLARGGFFVAASVRGGTPTEVRIESTFGRKCRVANPWPKGSVTLHRPGKPGESLAGPLLNFPMQPGEKITLAPPGATPSPLPVAFAARKDSSPLHLEVTLPDGKPGKASLGK